VIVGTLAASLKHRQELSEMTMMTEMASALKKFLACYSATVPACAQ
jgi:hypothetical protein